ncbi:MAG: AmmeMemoRadiSam system radical SAM enzyme [Armatimonadota bacterium]
MRSKRAGRCDDPSALPPGEGGTVTEGEKTSSSRRQFLRCAAFAAGGLCAAGLAAGGVSRLGRATESVAGAIPAAPGPVSPLRMAKAKYWRPLANKRVQCLLCPKRCEVGDRERGFCGVRENREGVYYTLVYGSAAAARPDPIEKKPLFHFLPGSFAFSIATAGCNMNCRDCQNWDLSQARPEQVRSQHLLPAEVAKLALESRCGTIAYTYNEPTVFYEYVYDTAAEGHKRGVRSVIISSGYINQEPLRALLPRLDAVKVDLKGFTEEFYRRYCSGSLKPVLETIKTVHGSGKWLELVVLIVPGLNDSETAVRSMCKWIRQTVGADVPLHFSRFYPNYQLRNLPPTPYATLRRCQDIAKGLGLHFVYLGNVPEAPSQNTVCPGCGKTLVERRGYTVTAMALRKGSCSGCGRRIPGVWD